ncbi:MAG TPA: enoyl-CoA hydratase-related protein [Burkholderiaceae bacterium]|nr:enoyl-CoA hydratase-related protein [Burkholderiaceae bacterium]
MTHSVSAVPAATPTDMVLAHRPIAGVLVLTLNRPEKANSLSTELVVQLCMHMRAAVDDGGIACVVLTGSERIFSAGADISGMATRGVEWYLDPERLERWIEIQNFPKPVIAAVNGPAIGGGCELALLCDIIIAGQTASFSQGEITVGVIPGDGATQRLPRQVGKSLAMQMILAGDRISAQRALQAGLVSEVVPVAQTVARSVEIAALIATRPPLSVQQAKRAVLASYQLPLDEGLLFERQRVVDVFKTEDRLEGMRAFLEKRPPNYRGK